MSRRSSLPPTLNVGGKMMELFCSASSSTSKKVNSAKKPPEYAWCSSSTGYDTLVNEFSDVTTIHGIRYFAGPNQNWLARTLWFTATITCFILCCITVYPQYELYMKGTVRTTLLVETESKLPFPAITFCNTNFMRYSAIGPNFNNLATSMMSKGWGVQDISNIFPSNVTSNSDFLKTFDIFKIWEHWEQMILVAHDSLQSIVSCTFAQENCADKFINKMTDYGWCFTFNPGIDYRSGDTLAGVLRTPSGRWYPNVNGTPLVVEAAGYGNGIDLVLNVQQYDYADAGGPNMQSAGFVVAIHDPEVDPLFQLAQYIYLRPGTRNEILLRLKRHQRDTAHLGRCVLSVPLKYYTNKMYQQASCYMECLTDALNATCNCTQHWVPEGAAKIINQRMLGANDSDLTHFVCSSMEGFACSMQTQQQLLHGASLQSACPQCRTPCSETYFATDQVTSQDFPAANLAHLYFDKKYPRFGSTTQWAFLEGDADFKNLTKTYERHFKGNGSYTSLAEVRDNLLAVRIYFTTTTVETILEDQLIRIEDLLSNLGGGTGLFLGASFLSFVELIHWAILAIIAKTRSQAQPPLPPPMYDNRTIRIASII